ncbi:hypothetical protein BJ508DRAFT_117192 [Ascobolus immersus RN42]|uniref:chitinase n=1 Tax=Ascobolus immersus RN42 TaxID=1160509 RepID=A0A3N4I4Y4_ASCIM|nr:hypothetical protein BJ508DRAFT_117192 [Ascobolus immersus RN42]
MRRRLNSDLGIISFVLTLQLLFTLLVISSVLGSAHIRHRYSKQHKHSTFTTPKRLSPPQAHPVSHGIASNTQGLTQHDAPRLSSSAISKDHTCGSSRPCHNGACCSQDGWCGYGPDFCGAGCQSNCAAKAECGKFADPPHKPCPLNVCCSKYGFCGTTKDFCGPGCQSNCKQPKPVAAKSNSQQKVIGYYESWSPSKSCGGMRPSEIPVDYLTHLIFAFGFVTPETFRITTMDGVPADAFQEVASLKRQQPGLQVLIAIGGWTHNDPGKWQKVFSNAVSTSENRALFISNLLGFMSEYGFDGVDWDWEYPGASDRGGVPEDGENFVKLLEELQTAIKSQDRRYIVTFTAPTSYWYLRHFNIRSMMKHVDWMNVMSYDLHGVWDSDNSIGNSILAHTNLTEIDMALDLLWRNHVIPEKVVLGLGFYGRSFELTDPKCWRPGCKFSGPGLKGRCSKTAGILAYQEIVEIIAETGAKEYYDKDAAVNYFVYGNGKHWVSYDNAATFRRKLDFASNLGLGGIMIWAIDLDTPSLEALKSVSPVDVQLLEPLALSSKQRAISHDTFTPTSCHIGERCGERCKPGFVAMTRVGKGPKGICPPDAFYYVCCPGFSAPKHSECQWHEHRTPKVESDCAGVCDIGELKIAGDSWGWKGHILTGEPGKECSRGGVVYCCKAGNAKRYLEICTWSKCSSNRKDQCKTVPGKPFELTRDAGGMSGSESCQANNHWLDYNPRGFVTVYRRSLCCPKKDSFKNCGWHWGKECSESCPDGKIELAKDQRGDDSQSGTCPKQRARVFCCDPPGGVDRPFELVDLDKLFPPPFLPPPDAVPLSQAIPFGSYANLLRGQNDLNHNGVAFLLIAGDTRDVASFRAKGGSRETLTFLDCPQDIFIASDTSPQVARVVCLSDDIEACFAVEEGGVEGTVVEMPENCGSGSWARAISLSISKDQHISDSIAATSSTSKVYDFTFDYNMRSLRRGSGNLSLRIDYSNTPGFWNAAVKSEGRIRRRFFSGKTDYGLDWRDAYEKIDFNAENVRSSGTIFSADRGVSNRLLYFEGESSCPVANGASPQGFAAGVQMDATGKIFYGFSLIATIVNGRLQVRESAGFMRVEGEADIEFDIGGLGKVDMSKADGRNPLYKVFPPQSLGGHSVFKGWATFVPYQQEEVGFGTKGPPGSPSRSAEFSGRASARIKVPFGKFTAHFPRSNSDNSENSRRLKNKIQVDRGKNRLYASKQEAAFILSSQLNLGLKVSLAIPQVIADGPQNLPDMSISIGTLVEFQSYPEAPSNNPCLDYRVQTKITQRVKNGHSVGWGDEGQAVLVFDDQNPTTGQCFVPSGPFYRSGLSLVPGSGIPGFNFILGKPPTLGQLGLGSYERTGLGFPNDALLLGSNTWGCTLEVPGEDGECCGCVCLFCLYGSDVGLTPCEPSGEDCDPPYASPYQSRSEADRMVELLAGVSESTKGMGWCQGAIKGRSYKYPSFPQVKSKVTGDDFARKFPDVGLYYSYNSEKCSDWACKKQTTARMSGVSSLEIGYQTEHVFEGQTLSYFFDHWLTKRELFKRRADEAPSKPDPNLWTDCAWQRKVFTTLKSTRFMTEDSKGRPDDFASFVTKEIGSKASENRLVIFEARPNQKKGNLFKGNEIMRLEKYIDKDAEHQILEVKELGLIFSYFNDHATVVDAFCKVVEGIYDALGIFDDVYENEFVPKNPKLGLKTGSSFKIQSQWRPYVRAALDEVQRRALAQYDLYYEKKRGLHNGSTKTILRNWNTNQRVNRPKIKWTWTCPNMESTKRPVPAAGREEKV